MSREVTAGLAESDGSLPPENDLKSHLRSDCLYTGIRCGLGNECGELYLLVLIGCYFGGLGGGGYEWFDEQEKKSDNTETDDGPVMMTRVVVNYDQGSQPTG